YEITISGINTTFNKCIDWVACKVDTPSTSNARTNFVGNYMNISGFVGTDEVTIDLYNWAMLPVNDSNVFRNVQLTVKDANDNVIETVSFPNAFVEFYRESYMRDKGFGKFDLQLKQKIDKNGDVGVSDSSVDEKVKSAAEPKILESVLGNVSKGDILDMKVSEVIKKPVNKYTYNMIENPGPLAAANPNAAATFDSGKYNVEVLEEDTIFYRGGKAGGGRNGLGQYFTRTPPESAIKVRIDTAVKSQWIDPKTGVLTGSSPIESVYAVKIPKGTTIYEGPTGYQSGVYLGPQEQVFISKPWETPGVQVLSETKLP
ncbi:MAG TPA: hypothetical protein VF941_08555, partial [Clostridia bacterium]